MREVALLTDYGNLLARFDCTISDRRLAALAVVEPEDVHHAFTELDDDGLSLLKRFEVGEFDGVEFLIRFLLGVGSRHRIDYPSFRAAYGDIFTRNEPVCQLWQILKNRGVKIVAVSNMDPIRYEWMKKLDIHRLCESEIVSCEQKIRKPDPEMIIRGVDAACVKAEDAFLVDDVPENIEAAAKVGVPGHLYDPDDPDGFKKLTDALISHGFPILLN